MKKNEVVSSKSIAEIKEFAKTLNVDTRGKKLDVIKAEILELMENEDENEDENEGDFTIFNEIEKVIEKKVNGQIRFILNGIISLLDQLDEPEVKEEPKKEVKKGVAKKEEPKKEKNPKVVFEDRNDDEDDDDDDDDDDEDDEDVTIDDELIEKSDKKKLVEIALAITENTGIQINTKLPEEKLRASIRKVLKENAEKVEELEEAPPPKKEVAKKEDPKKEVKKGFNKKPKEDPYLNKHFTVVDDHGTEYGVKVIKVIDDETVEVEFDHEEDMDNMELPISELRDNT
jgi:hypothetical protein